MKFLDIDDCCELKESMTVAGFVVPDHWLMSSHVPRTVDLWGSSSSHVLNLAGRCPKSPSDELVQQD